MSFISPSSNKLHTLLQVKKIPAAMSFSSPSSNKLHTLLQVKKKIPAASSTYQVLVQTITT